MIKAEELRIGNLVMRYSNIMQVSGVSLECADLILLQPNTRVNWRMLYSDIFGIPLTEEWLIKFGAKKLKAKRGVLKEFVLKTVRLELSNSHNFYYKNSKVIITSVHQLQNLYYALTGQELTISKGE